MLANLGKQLMYTCVFMYVSMYTHAHARAHKNLRSRQHRGHMYTIDDDFFFFKRNVSFKNWGETVELFDT